MDNNDVLKDNANKTDDPRLTHLGSNSEDENTIVTTSDFDSWKYKRKIKMGAQSDVLFTKIEVLLSDHLKHVPT